MKKIGKAASFLTKYISVVILIGSALAFWKPSFISWATDYTSFFLGAAMFGMGLTIICKAQRNPGRHAGTVHGDALGRLAVMQNFESSARFGDWRHFGRLLSWRYGE